MNTNYTYKKDTKTKIKDKIKMKLSSLKEYDCKFLIIELSSKEGSKTFQEDLMIGVNSKEDIDKLIDQLNHIKLKM